MSEVSEFERLVDNILGKALSLPLEEQVEYVKSACHHDAKLRREVLDLLQRRDASDVALSGIPSLLARLKDSEAGVSQRGSDIPVVEGDVINQYLIQHKIGQGGMGVVYRGIDLWLDRPVALKFVSLFLSEEDEAWDRLIAEARAVASLDHMNVGGVFEVDRTAAGQLFIAMPYYEGKTVRDLITHGPAGFDQIELIAQGVGSALGHAHSHGIVHRDVKPSNIVITANDDVKLIDFGIAQVAGVPIRLPMAGTLAYVSPEQLQSLAITPRSDIWALGVVLYEMISGERPFAGGSREAVVKAVLHQSPRSLKAVRPSTPARFRRVVDCCLEKDPSDRYQSAEDLLEEMSKRRHLIPTSVGQFVREGIGHLTGPDITRSRVPLELRRAILDEVESQCLPHRRENRATFNKIVISILPADESHVTAFKSAVGNKPDRFVDALRQRLADVGVYTPRDLDVSVRYLDPGEKSVDVHLLDKRIVVKTRTKKVTRSARLTVVTGRASAETFSVTSGSSVKIGRGKMVRNKNGQLVRTNDVDFLDYLDPVLSKEETSLNRTISGAHATVWFDEELRGFVLRDDRSSNGSFLVRKGFPCTIPVRARPVSLVKGDVVFLGKVALRFET